MQQTTEDLPNIVGALVTAFHSREGHKILWSNSEIDLKGCEYKTLPSGIEKIPDDVIYFTQGNAIGLAAYKNRQLIATHERPTISCVSIAVLVHATSINLRHERLNKVWLFNSLLRDLVNRFDPDEEDYTELESLFKNFKNASLKKRPNTGLRAQSPPASPVLSHRSSFKNYQSFRSERQTTQGRNTTLLPTQELSNLHPVLSLHDCISLFGPLILPVYRAALARRRILLLTDAPVQRACHFIYNIMLISAIPNDTSTMKRPLPLKQLFCIGLNDIPALEGLSHDSDFPGWIAVTTDKLFESKTHLWDLLIKLPSDSFDQNLSEKSARPVLISNDGMQINPSHLDAKNFGTLKPLLPMYQAGLKVRPQASWKRSILDSIISGAWYWTSAGHSLELGDEEIYLEGPDDARMVLPDGDENDCEEDSSLIRTNAGRGDASDGIVNGRDEVILLVLFHRLTANILSTMDGLSCESLDDQIQISREQMVRIGLTPRLAVDVKFIEDLTQRWFGREVVVDKSFWPCC